MKKIHQKHLDLMSSLQIPRDLSHRESIITLYGTSEMFIENYRSILEYTNTCIRILCKKGRLKILGSHLCIEYYCNDEMKITGRFQSVFFE